MMMPPEDLDDLVQKHAEEQRRHDVRTAWIAVLLAVVIIAGAAALYALGEL